LALAIGYLVFYKLAGYGVKGSAVYIDPISSPLQYLTDLPPKLLSLAGAMLLGVTAIIRNYPGAESIPVVAGIIGLGVLGVGLFVGRPFEEEDGRRLKWLAVMEHQTFA
jgi:hypothetical protein